MTPLNNGRLNDDVWRSKVEQMVKDEHSWAREQIDGEKEDRESLARELRDGYVTKEVLGYQLKGLIDTSEELKKALRWFIAIVVGFFLSAVAKIVLINPK